MKFLTTIALVSGMALSAGAAAAGTLSFDSAGSQMALDDVAGYNPNGTAGSLSGLNLNVFTSANDGPGLIVGGETTMTVTYLGKEAGNTNIAFSTGSSVLSTASSAIGSSYTTAAGFPVLDFLFQSFAGANFYAAAGNASGSITTNAAIAFSDIMNDAAGDFVYAFFDDSGAGVDGDFDDMVVKIQVAPVPLPAGMLLLCTGLAGLGFARRRKAA